MEISKARGRCPGRATDKNPPAAIAEGHRQSNSHDDERELSVRDDGFGAMLDGVLDFVLLQFFARNMLGHARSPVWSGISNRSTSLRSQTGSERGRREGGGDLPFRPNILRGPAKRFGWC